MLFYYGIHRLIRQYINALYEIPEAKCNILESVKNNFEIKNI